MAQPQTPSLLSRERVSVSRRAQCGEGLIVTAVARVGKANACRYMYARSVGRGTLSASACISPLLPQHPIAPRVTKNTKRDEANCRCEYSITSGSTHALTHSRLADQGPPRVHAPCSRAARTRRAPVKMDSQNGLETSPRRVVGGSFRYGYRLAPTSTVAFS